MPGWFVKSWSCCYQIAVWVHLSEDVSRWNTQVNGLPQGSVLFCTTLFNLYTNDLLSTRSRKCAYSDDICCGTQAQTFIDLECTFTADIIGITDYCHKWRLKQRLTNTVSSEFHLHNASAKRELKITMNERFFRHYPNPVYHGVTLDQRFPKKFQPGTPFSITFLADICQELRDI